MELQVPLPGRLLMAVLAITAALITPALGQISSPCNASMLARFTPCMNFVTNSSSNGTSPTSDCCNALKSFTGSGMDCLCLIVTGSVPFQVPINRSLAISLPRACNMPGVPVQCKASGAPIPAPAPASLGPTLSPGASPSASLSPSPTASSIPQPVSPALSPESDTTPLLTPPSTTGGSESPTENTGSRPVVNPSAATMPSYSVSSSVLLFAVGCLVMKLY
ncbi:Bifunctional inhibitor/plant lipid transfer protein/seed storage helical domain containing protein [Trema orientale]|uniref:Bifunctional inhibitor/plant lipid transfer protein/seed storage helical domain containing protein n=1 Tax=Trema orientale TaxID=63057 RepID=A0A2P5FWF7_TREOI|nr:Bifunctional inhibitor/plant lipid transfer protein/seed storage helical domain containing protein [Trema orientale]